MKIMRKTSIFLLFLWTACVSSHSNTGSGAKTVSPVPEGYVYPWLEPGVTVERRVNDIPLPAGFARVNLVSRSFGDWLRYIPLLPAGTPVLLYDGRKKVFQKGAYAVMSIDVGRKDLQQCADAVLRLRAEYLYGMGSRDELQFPLVDDFTADYAKWQQGYRIREKNNHNYWVKTGSPGQGYGNFKAFLESVFIYANSYSLTKMVRKNVSLVDIMPGDVWVKPGFPGHAVIVMDTATNSQGERIFLLAQSYMPAQSVHILNSFEDISPWYQVKSGEELKTPEWVFHTNELVQFRD